MTIPSISKQQRMPQKPSLPRRRRGAGRRAERPVRPKTFNILGTLALSLVVTGCAAFSMPDPPIHDVSPVRKIRKKKVVDEFERRRDQLQYQAAISRWEAGDVAGGEELLLKLLTRNPKHREARLLLADVYTCKDNPAAAEMQLEILLKDYPADAQVHHSMGLLLEADGNVEKAAYHYKRASEIEPGYKLYEMSYEAAVATIVGFQRRQATMRVSDLPPGAGFEPPETVRATASPLPIPIDPAQRYPVQVASAGEATEASYAGSGVSQSFSDSSGFHRSQGVMAGAEGELAHGHLLSAVAAIERGHAEDALLSFRNAMATEPKNERIPTAASVYLLRLGQTDLAARLLAEAIEMHRKSSTLYRALGTAHYLCEDFQAAQIALEKALSLDNTSALAYFLLGSTMAELGLVEEAASNFERAHRLDPRYPARR